MQGDCWGSGKVTLREVQGDFYGEVQGDFLKEMQDDFLREGKIRMGWLSGRCC